MSESGGVIELYRLYMTDISVNGDHRQSQGMVLDLVRAQGFSSLEASDMQVRTGACAFCAQICLLGTIICV